MTTQRAGSARGSRAGHREPTAERAGIGRNRHEPDTARGRPVDWSGVRDRIVAATADDVRWYATVMAGG